MWYEVSFFVNADGGHYIKSIIEVQDSRTRPPLQHVVSRRQPMALGRAWPVAPTFTS